MQIGYVGLGKMGQGMVARLLEKGHQPVVFDGNRESVSVLIETGASIAESIEDLAHQLPAPRTVWIMVPHTAVDAVLTELMPHLAAGDTIIDGGNSKYTESKRRADALLENGVRLLDAGISGGPKGAREGACIMVGGERNVYEEHESLFRDLAAPGAYAHVGSSGAGHYVKMVHNGIEYGMMQAIAEGFSLMKESEYVLDLKEIAHLYNQKSVIESRLIGWLAHAYEAHGQDLESVTGIVSHSGEGQWTVEEAERFGTPPLAVIEAALQFRKDSQDAPSYRGKIVSALRNQFGGHDVGATEGR